VKNYNNKVPALAHKSPITHIRWVESTFEDFADGQVADAMYVSHRRSLDCDSGCVEYEAKFDLNNDGYYDLIASDARGPYVRVYFGSATGYSPDHCRVLPVQGGDACDIADLNCDGHADIYINSYSYTPDFVLWGPDWARCDTLPRRSDHHGMFREPGNVYDRRYQDYYISSVYDIGENRVVLGGICSWVNDEPRGAAIHFEYRSGPIPEPDSSWTDFYSVSCNGGRLPPEIVGNRYLQHRSKFNK